ncbi:hypothetical protein Taro_050293 [Colocasia esculenta]|uniref:Uncharacterized protein n=1 Tax=Colocasia esculenta TaxID=4460 RepID=A0A843XD16_COLES|nr:hypothetical protein [Colocasia esculenta]
MWRSSWRLESRRSSIPSSSSSPIRLLRPAQTVHLKSTKDSYLLRRTGVTGVPVPEKGVVKIDAEKEE